MISKKAFISSLQNKTIIELEESTKLIEDTITKSFNSIKDELISQIKSNVRDELIKKIGSSDDIDDNFKKTLLIGMESSIRSFKNGEFSIGFANFGRYAAYSYNGHRQVENHSITYTNYNNIYDTRNNGHKSGKTIKLSKPLIILINNIFKSIGKMCKSGIQNRDGDFDYGYGDTIIHFLSQALPNIIYEIQEKYYGDNNFGVYGCKFEEIIEDYHKLQKEMQIKNTSLENAKKDLERLYSENDRLKKELEECAKLKEILIGLKNTV